MKRNIISSKVEPQNTEDLWLNLVDGNIYSYEYGTWTNVNNVPNRVFNLDIDYTEENLTKFLSPLYEEGFSDDDFPKKVWDKFCETNPEFKLQGERENIRINCDLCYKGQVIDNFKNSGYNEVPFNGIMKVVDGVDEIEWPTTSSMSGRLFIYDLDLKITKGAYDSSTKISRISNDETLWDSVDYYNDAYNKYIPIHILNQYNILNKKHDFMYKHSGNFDMDIDGIYFIIGDPFIVKIASADIKLKQAHASSSIVYSNEGNMSIIGYGIEYISGLVTNKLDSKKMWEYLGEDIKYLIPARIDLVLPYDMSLYDSFPDIVNNADIFNIFLPDLEMFLYFGLSKHFHSGQYSDLDPYTTYANLCSPIKLGLYKNRVNKKDTPIDLLQTDYPTELKDVYVNMNVKYSDYPDYWDNINDLDIGTSKHYYFIDTYLSFKYDFKFSDSVHEGHDFFNVFIADLNICLSVETTGGYNIHYFNREEPLNGFSKGDILYTGTSWEDIVKYAKSNYSLSEKTKYKLVYIKAEAESAGVLTDIIIPTPDLKPIEYIHFVGSDDDYATKPNTVTFNDLGIQILYQQSRHATKNCNILDLKTGIEYTLNDLGYSNKAWIPDLLIPEDGNNHYSSGYMLASTFKEILDKFKILNKKHSSIEVDLYDGSNMEQYLGTNYIFTVIDAKDKDKTDIVKLASQEISLMRTWEFGSGSDIIYTNITELFYPGEVTPEFFKELEKEGWEVSY